MKPEVVSNLHDAAPTAGLTSEFIHALQEMRQRLFNEHVSSGAYSPQSLRNMKDRRRADERGVGLVSIQSGAEVLKDLDSELAANRCTTLGIRIARRQPYDSKLAQVRHVAPPDGTGPDHENRQLTEIRQDWSI
jgi:hypothetical protein